MNILWMWFIVYNRFFEFDQCNLSISNKYLIIKVTCKEDYFVHIFVYYLQF